MRSARAVMLVVAVAGCSGDEQFDDASLAPDALQPVELEITTWVEPGATVTIGGEAVPLNQTTRVVSLASQQELRDARYDVVITRGDETQTMFIGSQCAWPYEGDVVIETYELYVGPADLNEPLYVGARGGCLFASGRESSWIAD